MVSPHTGQGLVSASMLAPLQLRYTPFGGRRQMRLAAIAVEVAPLGRVPLGRGRKDGSDWGEATCQAGRSGQARSSRVHSGLAEDRVPQAKRPPNSPAAVLP